MGLADLMVEAMQREDAADASQTDAAYDHEPVDEPVDEHEWRYETLPAWVHEWLVPTLERDRNKTTLAWCSWWWKHPEAVTVLGALWHQWEASQDQPWTGMSSYLAHYHFPLLNQLTRPDGPFGPCWTESRSTRTPTHREHDQHFAPPDLAPVTEIDDVVVAAEIGAVAAWMPPPTSSTTS